MVNQQPKTMSQPSDSARAILRLLPCYASAEQRYRSAIASALGITMTEATALGYVLAGTLSPDELAHELALSPGGAIALMQRLEKRGHARRLASPGEPSSVIVSPSAPLQKGHASVLTTIADRLVELSPREHASIAVFIRGAARATEDAAALCAGRSPAPPE